MPHISGRKNSGLDIEDLGHEPEEALAEFEARVSALRKQSEAVREEVSQATGFGRSADGAIEAHARAGGQITKIVVGDKAARSTPSQLASSIHSAISQAQVAAAQASLDILASYYGEDEATKQIRTALAVDEEEAPEPEDGWTARPRYGYLEDEDEEPHGGRSWK